VNKSILILEENSMIHGLVAAALDLDGVTLHHEFDPDEYVARARTLMPDLILLSNADQQRGYEVCRELRADTDFRSVPLVLLAGSKDQLRQDMLRELHVSGVVRKPFEASDLQQQVSKHLDLVDLIGSAFEYKKSQSMREDGMNPLNDLEVLDQEILGFLRESAEMAGGAKVPQVDFGAELAAERAAPKSGARAGGGAGMASTASMTAMVEESVLEEALEPERAFEPVESPLPMPDETLESAPPMPEEPAGLAMPIPDELESELLSGDLPLAGRDFDETGDEGIFAPEGALAGGTKTLEELGSADVLDEEADEESRWAPQGFDETFEGGAGKEEAPLEDVEMELAGADVDFGAAGDDLDEGEVELFETDFGKPAPAAARSDDEEMIPAAVRRMVEMKPVLTRSQAIAPVRAEPEEDRAFHPDDAELTAMAEELDQMDEIPVGDAFAAEPEAEPELEPQAPAASGWKLAQEGAELEGEEEMFSEDYLGDEEIDEDKIREALEAEPAADSGFEVLLDDADSAMDEDLLEDSELKELEALDEVDLGLTDEGEEEEIVIEPDEESMVLASIERDEELERQGGDTVLEDAKLESAGDGGAPGMEPLEPGLLDRQLDALEEGPEAMGVELETGFETAEPEAAPWDTLAADEEPFISAEAREMAAFAGADAELPAGEEAGEFEIEDLEEPEFAAPAHTGFDDIETASKEVEMPKARPAAGAMSDFDSVLADLQAEIEANPVGERLEDVLQREGIVEAVEALDFAIPQHEHPFSRALGVFEIPGGDSAGRALIERMTAKPGTSGPSASNLSAAIMAKANAAARTAVSGAVTVGMGGAMGSGAGRGPALAGMHDALASRLTEVLDEMIRDTVRRVVREEVPELMERMKEDAGHGH
jgi:CheY-like chemotaxis protein